jgi:hypothetical protein
MPLIRRWLRVGLLAVLALALTGEIKKEEFDCEEAVQHLADCCPGFDPHNIDCYSDSCNGPIDLDEHLSSCIKAASCHEIALQNACNKPTGFACP